MARMIGSLRDKILAEMDAEDEWKHRRKAFKVAREKADVQDRVTMRRYTYEERDLLYRVYPAKFYIANYWLEEKTKDMRAKRLKYKFVRSEDPKDPEVVLHLFKRSKRKRVEVDQGEAGDLYTVELFLPSGGSVEIHIVAESLESMRGGKSRLLYSVFDVGCQEHAYTVPCEAWQNYLLFRENVDGVREEMDIRLLFCAIGNRAHIGGCTLEGFRAITLYQVKRIREEMMAGETYVRPTTIEAQLSMEDMQPRELLRGPIRRDLTPRFDFLAVRRRSSLKPKKQPCFTKAVELELEDNTGARGKWKKGNFKEKRSQGDIPEVKELPQDVKSLILDCFNPYSSLNIESREIAQQAQRVVEELDETSSRSTLRSWSGSGWMSENGGQGGERSSQCSEERASNPSEAEAMGPLSRYSSADLTIYPDDITMKTQEISNLSMVSGLEEMAISAEESLLQEDAEVADRDAEGIPNVQPMPALEEADEEEDVLPDLVETSKDTIEESEEEDDALGPVNLSYMFNDSVEWYLSKVANESQIVTVSSDDSVDVSDQAEIIEQLQELDDDSDLFQDDAQNVDYVIMGFNLKRSK